MLLLLQIADKELMNIPGFRELESIKDRSLECQFNLRRIFMFRIDYVFGVIDFLYHVLRIHHIKKNKNDDWRNKRSSEDHVFEIL